MRHFLPIRTLKYYLGRHLRGLVLVRVAGLRIGIENAQEQGRLFMTSRLSRQLFRWMIFALCLAGVFTLARAEEPKAAPTLHNPATRLLFQSVWRSDVDGVRRALGQGADMMSTDYKTHYSSWLWAAMMGNADVMRLLLEEHPAVDTRSAEGATALKFAVQGGFVEIAMLLLDAGADVNLEYPDGRRALTYAAEAGHKEMISLLELAGADLSTKFLHGGDDLLLAASAGDLERVKNLVKEDSPLDNAMMKALHHGQTEVVSFLLSHGAKANTVKANLTALMWAASDGHCAIIRELLDHGAEINAQDAEGATALMWAVGAGRREAVRLLIERGCDPMLSTTEGKSPLMKALEWGNVDIVMLLKDLKKKEGQKDEVRSNEAEQTKAKASETANVDLPERPSL